LIPLSDAYFVSPLAQGKQCGFMTTGVYQPSLRSPWLAATVRTVEGMGKAKPLIEHSYQQG